jgi:hypothetical protein
MPLLRSRSARPCHPRDPVYDISPALFAHLPGPRCALVWETQKCEKYLARDPNLSPQVDDLMRVFRAYEQATTSTTVRGSWQKADFGFLMRSGTQYLWVDEAKIRGPPDFLELWAMDYPEESLSLSARRRQQKWDGWTEASSAN